MRTINIIAGWSSLLIVAVILGMQAVHSDIQLILVSVLIGLALNCFTAAEILKRMQRAS